MVLSHVPSMEQSRPGLRLHQMGGTPRLRPFSSGGRSAQSLVDQMLARQFLAPQAPDVRSIREFAVPPDSSVLLEPVPLR